MKPNIRFFLYSVVLVLALATLGNLITELVRSQGSTGIAITMTVLISVCLFIALFNYESPKTPRQIELSLIKKIKGSWLQSLIDVKSSETIRTLELNWVAAPPSLKLRNPQAGSSKFVAILEAFEAANRSLLIVGKPGAGKTLALLELAGGLTKLAEEDPVQGIPVVLNLSSFAGVNLAEWLVTELKTRYDVAEDISRGLLLQKRLILLLDGLDETANREQCARAIKEFANQSPGPGMAVAADWEIAKLTAIKSAVEAPLRGTDCSENLDLIVRRLRAANQLQPEFEANKVVAWLHWLAVRSADYRQSQFTVAQIQPNWLNDRLFERLYLALSRLAGALTVMSLGATMLFLSGMILRSISNNPQAQVPGLFDIEGHLKWWLLVTVVVGGLTIGLIDKVHMDFFPRIQNGSKARIGNKQNFLSLAVYVLTCFVTFLAVARMQVETVNAVRGATIFAVAYGVVFWFRGRERSLANDTNTADKLVWSRARIPVGLGWGILGGTCSGLLFALVLKFDASASQKGQMLGLLTLLGALVGAIAGGLRRVSIVENISPTQGIRMSVRSLMLIWLSVSAPAILLIWGYVALVMNAPEPALGGALFYGMILGLLCGFAYSGFGIVYRLIFRLIVWWRGHAPLLDWVRFLDYAASLGFLRKVGGGYVFSQTTLRQCFAQSSTPLRVSENLKDPNSEIKPTSVPSTQSS